MKKYSVCQTLYSLIHTCWPQFKLNQPEHELSLLAASAGNRITQECHFCSHYWRFSGITQKGCITYGSILLFSKVQTSPEKALSSSLPDLPRRLLSLTSPPPQLRIPLRFSQSFFRESPFCSSSYSQKSRVSIETNTSVQSEIKVCMYSLCLVSI